MEKGPIFEILNFLLGLAIGVFGLWFWFEVVGTKRVVGYGFAMGGQVVECQGEFGFFFSMVGLRTRGFVVAHILVGFLMVVGVCLLSFFSSAFGDFGDMVVG